MNKFFTTCLVIGLIGITDVLGQSIPQKPDCYECALPQTSIGKENIADVILNNGTVLYGATSLKRIILNKFGSYVQALSVSYKNDSKCRDTTLLFTEIKELRISGLGPNGGTLATPIYPAREYIFTQGTEQIPSSFLEITPTLFVSGSDASIRKVGFNSIAYGAEVLISPFGKLFGNRLSLAFGGGALLESSRLRIPVLAHLRYTILGGQEEQVSNTLVPSPCKFRLRDTSILSSFVYEKPSPIPFDSKYEEITSLSPQDSTVFVGRKNVIVRDDFRPFIFLEGGPIFNGNFIGKGAEPSVNPDDYSQYAIGAGIGTALPFAQNITMSLGYRYMRLNLRTPCASCPPPASGEPEKFFFLNTNNSHSVMLKFGWRLEWIQ